MKFMYDNNYPHTVLFILYIECLYKCNMLRYKKSKDL